MIIAEVCVNVATNSIDKNFTYRVPERLNFLAAGWRVTVSFGGRRVDGFVMSVHEVEDSMQFNFALKEIDAAIDDEPWFTPEMMNAAHWLAEFYLCPLSLAMGLFMPGKRGKKISPRVERFLSLAKDFDAADFSRAPAQLKFLQLLKERGTIRAGELAEQKISSDVVRKLIAAGYVANEQRRIFRDSYSQIKSVPKTFELTDEQQTAIATVEKFLSARKFAGFLLHGVTGSGKTQVYIELTKITRRMGRQAIILVPEIALTGQAVTNFKAHFSDVAVIHSRLSLEERSDAFHRIRDGKVGVIIGARSALFTPAGNIGLIVVDEEQDTSYKQDNSSPRYHARVVAEEFAKFHDAALVFGSATPSLENFHRAQIGELTLLKMPRRVLDNPLPEVECVDMRGELRVGNRSVLSRALIELLRKTLAAKQQAILLLNRRGWSTVVMCRECGAVSKCPDCGLPMTYHADGTLLCHNCGIELEPPKICPTCGSRHIKFLGTGTEKLETALKNLLPNARIQRMDRDSTGGKFGHKKILDAFAAHEFDILFGTQMVAKGHDIDNVTAVGILSADATLNLPDFRASEQCFMLITQAAGRAGRAELKGKVVVQAYNPDHEAVVFGCRQDYDSFCRYELPLRKELMYPPYSRMIKLIFTGKDDAKVQAKAQEIVNIFDEEFEMRGDSEAMGPAPAIVAKYKDIYRFVVIIKTTELNRVIDFLRKYQINIRDDIIIDIDPTMMF